MEYKIDLDTLILDLNKTYEENNGCLPALSETLSSNELIELISFHKDQCYNLALYQSIAFHKNVTDEIHKILLNISKYENGVANAVATSGKASLKVLEHLLKHKSEHVVEHANYAIKHFKENNP